jgi:hemolysin activation/secretion protein
MEMFVFLDGGGSYSHQNYDMRYLGGGGWGLRLDHEWVGLEFTHGWPLKKPIPELDDDNRAYFTMRLKTF